VSADQRGSGVLDAIEGLAFEIEHVQLRVRALELRMNAQEADPGPELVARRLRREDQPIDEGWESFERRAQRVVSQLRELERAAARTTEAALTTA
jgi:hypothetical protein